MTHVNETARPRGQSLAAIAAIRASCGLKPFNNRHFFAGLP